MSTMVVEIYDALKEAGASEDSARRAAGAVLQGDVARLDRLDASIAEVEVEVEVAGLRQDFNGLRQDFNGLRQEFNGLRQEFGGLRREVDQLGGRMATQTRMIGFVLSLTLLMLGKLFLAH